MTSKEQKNLQLEITEIIERQVDQNDAVVSQWVVKEVMAVRNKIEGEDTLWYQVCAEYHVEDTVKRMVRKFKGDAQAPEQLELPGYEKVQQIYSIERRCEDGKVQSHFVRVEALTDDEIDAKCAEMAGMMKGLGTHIDNLQRFKADRSRKQVTN